MASQLEDYADYCDNVYAFLQDDEAYDGGLFHSIDALTAVMTDMSNTMTETMMAATADAGGEPAFDNVLMDKVAALFNKVRLAARTPGRGEGLGSWAAMERGGGWVSR